MANSLTSYEYKFILQIHKSLGYPAISEQAQVNVLLGRTTAPILGLTPEFKIDTIPLELYRHYITISKQTFKSYFVKSDYIERNIQKHRDNSVQDGEWIVPLVNGVFQMIFQERGNVYNTIDFSNREELSDYLIEVIYRRYDLVG